MRTKIWVWCSRNSKYSSSRFHEGIGSVTGSRLTEHAVWLMLLFFFFYFCGHVCKSQLCWSGWGESKAGPSYSEQRLGKLDIYSLLSSVEALLALARASLGDRVMQTKWRRSSRVCVKLCSGLLVPLCCWSFLWGLQGSPWAILVHRYSCRWSVSGNRGLLLHHLGDISL